jgi:hypothetical protein
VNDIGVESERRELSGARGQRSDRASSDERLLDLSSTWA